jgi:murein DD-endopeptidase MepM/ murein hydrolase activator NlpD
MGFDWNLDGSINTEGSPSETALPEAVLSEAALPEASVPLAALPSRRELRMSALNRPPVSKSAKTAVAVASKPRSVQRHPAKRSLRRRLLPKMLSFGAMLGAAALLVSSSIPANALMTTSADAVVPLTHVQSQSIGAVDSAAIAQTPTRDKYTVISLVQQMATRFMSTNWAYTNDPNGTIQWPFPVQVPISTGFGPRHVAGCSFCSTYHEGVDFDPGQGVPIQSIADGVVSQVVESHAGLGNHVVVDHVINGQQVQSVYGHMLDGSIKVVVGQQIKVTDIIGLVGSTGESTGAHLHLEVHLNGVPIDPFAWLKANAN